MLILVREAPLKAATTGLVTAHGLVDAASDRVQRVRDRSEFGAVWIVVILIGIFVIGGIVLATYCLQRGFSGGVIDFNVKTHTKWKIPVGIKLSILCA